MLETTQWDSLQVANSHRLVKTPEIYAALSQVIISFDSNIHPSGYMSLSHSY